MKEAQNEDRAKRLAEGRQSLREKGISPRARGREKMRFALDWLYRWGWSTPTIMETISGAQRGGFSGRLVKNKLVQETKTAVGGYVQGMPRKYLTLTEFGQAEAERFRETLIEYEFRDQYRVNQETMRHDLLSQQATAEGLRCGLVSDYRTPREMAARSESGVQQPDVLWIQPDGRRVAVEVELTPKWNRRFDQFRARVIASLEGEKPRFDLLAFVSDSPAILARYQRGFRPGTAVPIWVRDKHSHWVTDGAIELPESIAEKLLWQDIS